MTEQSAPIKFDSPRQITPEDQARANFYALLANLFYRAPDDRLLQAVAVAEPPDGALHDAWVALGDAASVTPADAVYEEYEELFIGVGKAPISLYGSVYLAGFMMEKPLAELRDTLAEMGFSRSGTVREPEDHVAALCDVMRALIVGDVNHAPAPIAAQHKFFSTHMQPWIEDCMGSISAYHRANFYKRVAVFASVFFEVEKDAFEMS
jgi:TorA maturation chaperone TorD